MSFFSLHGICLELAPDDAAGAEALPALLEDLSFSRIPSDHAAPALRIEVSRCAQHAGPPRSARTVFEQQPLIGYAADAAFYLKAGSSLFALRASAGLGEARLAPDFAALSASSQQQFWAFGLLWLLRTLGIFGLHSAALVSPLGRGMLLTGESGSGKSTLTLGLVQSGWRYASDDSVLLRARNRHIEAMALRKPLSILRADSDRFSELEPALATAHKTSGRKCRLDLRERFPDRFVPVFQPEVLLLCRIIDEPDSRLRPIDAISGLKELLQQSGLQLMEPQTAQLQLRLLQQLIHQCRVYELSAGRDLYEAPSRLPALLSAVESENHGPPHRRTHQPV